MSGVRCFVALELPPDIVGALLAAGGAIRGSAPEWRGEKWVAEENLHITLKFLGTLAEERIDPLRRALTDALADQARFTLRLADVRAVPTAKRCSMVWAAFHDDEDRACEVMAQRVNAAVADVVEEEGRLFAPHVTLVRARKPHRLLRDALAAAHAALSCPDASMSVLSATLFASTLTRRGPIYERLAQWEFPSPG